MSKIILLFGRKGSGKDTAADGLCVFFPGTFRYALAEPIRDFLKAVFDWTDEHFTPERKEQHASLPSDVVDHYFDAAPVFLHLLGCKDSHESLDDWFVKVMMSRDTITPRTAMQTLGTDWGRAQDPDLWIRLGIRACERALEAGAPLAVITDGRFENEVRCVLAAGGHCIKIERPGLPRDAHESEAGQDRVPEGLFRSVIENRGTTADLQASAVSTVRGAL